MGTQQCSAVGEEGREGRNEDQKTSDAAPESLHLEWQMHYDFEET